MFAKNGRHESGPNCGVYQEKYSGVPIVMKPQRYETFESFLKISLRSQSLLRTDERTFYEARASAKKPDSDNILNAGYTTVPRNYFISMSKWWLWMSRFHDFLSFSQIFEWFWLIFLPKPQTIPQPINTTNWHREILSIPGAAPHLLTSHRCIDTCRRLRYVQQPVMESSTQKFVWNSPRETQNEAILSSF